MQFVTVAAVLSGLASAASVNLAQRNTPLALSLEMVGNTMVKATLVNNGNEDLKVLKTGSIIDDMDTEKVFITTGDKPVEFEGMHLSVATEDVEEGAFQIVRAGETVTSTFNIGEVYNLSAGGHYTVQADGMLSVAELNSTTVSDAIPYLSNAINVAVQADEAAETYQQYNTALMKRTKVGRCQGQQLQATLNALKNCQRLALTAQKGVNGDKKRFLAYFKTQNSAQTVQAVFGRAAQECSSSNGGVSQYYCEDVTRGCKEGTNAYTVPAKSFLVNCPRWFQLPARSNKLHVKDQGTVTLHEMTHLKQIKGTSDYGTYGFAGVQKLPANKNVNHADSYSLFAQSFDAN